MKLSPWLFWDADPEQIDFESHSQWVIARVLMRGLMTDLREIQAYYGNDRILKEMMKVRYLDPLTLQFLSTIFNVPKEKFRCYSEAPSAKKHWFEPPVEEKEFGFGK